jgi:hypothetical protein
VSEEQKLRQPEWYDVVCLCLLLPIFVIFAATREYCSIFDIYYKSALSKSRQPETKG